MLRNDENRALGNWILARNFLEKIFWPLFLRVDCNQSQDASIKPSWKVCSQKPKLLWPWPPMRNFLRIQWVPGTRTKTVLSGTKSCPIEGNCALAHWTDTGTAHAYSHDRVGTPHGAPRFVRIEFTVWIRSELVSAGTTCSAVTSYCRPLF